jgi:hypothetical protein
MDFDQPIPYDEALTALNARQELPNTLTSRELERLGPAILARSRFSAGVVSGRILAGMDQQVQDIIDGKTSIVQGMKHLGEVIDSTGYTPAEGDEGTIKDLRTLARRRLMIETNVDLITGRGHWMQGQKQHLLDDWPIMELVRVRRSERPRDWPEKWPAAARAAGSMKALEVFQNTGRMVARKDDPIWTWPLADGGFNRFGVPWGPFDYNSGMGTRDRDRATALALGIITADEAAPAPDEAPDMNDDLQASLSDLPAGEIRDALLEALGDQVKMDNGILTYAGKN